MTNPTESSQLLTSILATLGKATAAVKVARSSVASAEQTAQTRIKLETRKASQLGSASVRKVATVADRALAKVIDAATSLRKRLESTAATTTQNA